MRRNRSRWLVVGLTILTLLALVGLALARPGGGDSYSGGGGHSGNGGSSGGGGDGGDILALIELVYYIVLLCIEFPIVGLVLVVGIAIWVIYSAYKQRVNKDWNSGPPRVQAAIDVSALRKHDPEFSVIVFEDFLFRLISTAHRARSSPDELAAVAPYVSASARALLADRDPRGVPIKQVIVGAMRAVRVDVPDAVRDGERAARTRVSYEIEANVATADQTYFSVETWTLSRDATLESKPPSPDRTFRCPNCGAPWQADASGTQRCASCHQVVDNGRFDWLVEMIAVESIDVRPPTLTTEVPERGTDLPTYTHPKAQARFDELKASDSAVGTAVVNARIKLIHRDIAEAWSKNDLTAIRGLVSDGLYDYLDYWVQAYKQQGLRNVMGDLRITKFELAKVTRDRHYDAITMRIWATGKDYVVEERTGKVVRGSKKRERPYSEYWTLIRSAGRKGPVHADRTCGNCGAPLKVSMAGACTYCNAHVTSGEFDWVLSRIEQDDSYRG